MKKISCFLLFIIFSLIITDFVCAGTFSATATIKGSGTFSFDIKGIYLINRENPEIETSTNCITWSSASNEGGYQQSDCYIAFKSAVTKAKSKIRIYTDVKNQNNYVTDLSSYTGSINNYFNGLIGQGTEESSYSVLPLAWHASNYKCTSDEDLTVEGNVSAGTYKYAYMIDKSDAGFETNNYSTVQWAGKGLRMYDDPDNGYVAVGSNATSYIYIGCNFNNAMPTVEYAAVIILEAFTE